MRPRPLATRCGGGRLDGRNAPLRLMSSVRSQSASVTSPSDATCITPALTTSVSSPPIRVAAAPTAPATAEASRTSQGCPLAASPSSLIASPMARSETSTSATVATVRDHPARWPARTPTRRR